MSPARRAKPPLTCSQCGRPEAQAIGGEILCASCCHERGSCGATGDEPISPSAAQPSRPADSSSYSSPACFMPEIED